MTIGKISSCFLIFVLLFLSCKGDSAKVLFKRKDIENIVTHEINQYKNDKYIKYLIVYYFLDSMNRELVAVIPRMSIYNLKSTYYLLNSKPRVVAIYQKKYLEDKFSNTNSKQSQREFNDSISEELIIYDKYPVIYEILDNKLIKLKNNEELLEETLIGNIPFLEPKEPPIDK